MHANGIGVPEAPEAAHCRPTAHSPQRCPRAQAGAARHRTHPGAPWDKAAGAGPGKAPGGAKAAPWCEATGAGPGKAPRRGKAASSGPGKASRRGHSTGPSEAPRRSHPGSRHPHATPAEAAAAAETTAAAEAAAAMEAAAVTTTPVATATARQSRNTGEGGRQERARDQSR
jgi:hypothetical protein